MTSTATRKSDVTGDNELIEVSDELSQLLSAYFYKISDKFSILGFHRAFCFED